MATEVEVLTNPPMLDSTGQAIVSAISAMGLSTIGNMANLTTTDKSSLVGAINEVKSGLTDYTTVYSVTADGVKTYAEILEELRTHIPYGKKCFLRFDDSILHCFAITDNTATFSRIVRDATSVYITVMSVSTIDNKFIEVGFSSQNAVTYGDYSSSVVTSGRILEILV